MAALTAVQLAAGGELTGEVARTIYGADGLKEAFSEAMTSTSIAPITLKTASAQAAP